MPPEKKKKRGGRRRRGPQVINNNYYCLGVFCDPGYEPYPNIVSAMTGYNIFKGNAYNLGVEYDPGFQTNYIFTPVVRDDDGRYALDSGITIRAISKCDFSMTTVVASSVDELKRIIRNTKTMSSGWKTNPPITIAVEKGSFSAQTEIPPLYEQYGSQNEDFQQHEEYFTKTQGSLTMNSATCALYTMQLNKVQPPPVHPTVKELIKEIIVNVDERTALFHVFVQSFGTHYLQSATMGSRLTISKRYTKDQMSKYTMTDIEKCNMDRMNVFFVHTTETTTCRKIENVEETKKNMIDDLYKREYMLSYGSKPAKSLAEWGNQEFSAPLPIKMELAPITDLFSKDFLMHIFRDEPGVIRPANMDAMHDASKELYKNYCKTNQEELGIDNCDVSEIVCGWNDGCDPRYDKCEQVDIDKVQCTPHDKESIENKFKDLIKQMSQRTRNDSAYQELAKTPDITEGRAYYIVAIDSRYAEGKILTSGDNVCEHEERHDEGHVVKAALAWTSKQRPAKPDRFKDDMDTIIDRKPSKDDHCRSINDQTERMAKIKDSGYIIDFYLESIITSVHEGDPTNGGRDLKKGMFRYSSEGTTPDYYPTTIEECKNQEDGGDIAIGVAIGLKYVVH